jgi:splicing factor 3B subunit 1
MSSVEDEIKALQAKRAQGDEAPAADERIGLLSKGGFDSDIYGGGIGARGDLAGEVVEEMEDDDAGPTANHPATRAQINADRSLLEMGTDADTGADPFAAYRDSGSGMVNTRIADREDEYKQRRMNRIISPDRGDVFSGATPARSYKDIMAQQNLKREEAAVLRAIDKKKEEAAEAAKAGVVEPDTSDKAAAEKAAAKRRRWDDAGAAAIAATPAVASGKEWTGDATPGRFAATPGRFDATPGRFDATPGINYLNHFVDMRQRTWDSHSFTPSLLLMAKSLLLLLVVRPI